MKNMQDLLESLQAAAPEMGLTIERGDNDIVVRSNTRVLSASFHKGNYCSNRHEDFGWATNNAEVMVWEAKYPYTIIQGPHNQSEDGSGVWTYQTPSEIENLIAEHLMGGK